MKYLSEDITTLEELKKAYRKLALKLHPDVGGSNEEMKILNAEYDEMFHKVGHIHMNKDGEFYEKDMQETPEEFRDLIEKLIIMEGIEIEIIGTFVCVTGDTKPHKEGLKALGFRWHAKKKCWYKAPASYKRRSRKDYNLDEIRSMYDSQVIRNNKDDVKNKCFMLA